MKNNPAEILKKRARLAAQVPEPDTPGTETRELLEFKLAAGTYYLEIRFIDDVQTLSDLTPLPGTPAFILGLMAVRGRIRCVVDLKVLLGIESAVTDRPKVILLADGGIEFGIAADSVETSRRIPLAAIRPPLAGPSLGSHLVQGLVGSSGILLDAQKLIHDPNLVVNQGESS